MAKQKSLADLVDYWALAADGIVLMKSGAYLAAFEFVGPDMDAISVEAAGDIAARMMAKLNLGRGWTIQCDLIRGEHPEYIGEEANWPDAISYLIEQERRDRHLVRGEAATRLSRYYLALSYEPVLLGARGTARWMFTATEEEDENQEEKALILFRKRLIELETALRDNLASVSRLRSYQKRVGDTTQVCDELLQYVRQCMTGDDYPFALPDVPLHLDQYLAPDDLLGGIQPELGDPMNELIPGKHIAVVAVDSFPAKSFAGILRELDSVPFDFRFCQQARLLDEQEASEKHKANRSNWGFKKTSVKAKLSPIKITDSTPPDPHAIRMEADAANAASNAEHGKEVYVDYSGKVIVMETSRERLKQTIEAVARVLKYRCGFSCRLETVNAVAAWLSSMPGQHAKDRRKFLISTHNVTHMLPLSAPWRGHKWNPSRKYFPPETPPLFYGVTSGGTPYRFHTHVSDVGHQLITGPTGSGKTTWLAFMIAQWFRYRKGQVFAFDKKRTLYTLTKAMGGEFIEISPDRTQTQLCPLAELETPLERDWAGQWIELLLVENGVGVTADLRNQIAAAIRLLAHGGMRDGRSLTDFQMAVESREVKSGLQCYIGGILDGDHDNLSMSRFCVFEMDDLYRLDKKTMNGALFYIFSKIRKRLSSTIPTLVTVDEFQDALTHELAAKRLNEFLDEGRKVNLAVCLVAVELDKILASPLRTAVLQQCATKVCLANRQAISGTAGAYEMLGMGPQDRELIACIEPKSHYYVTSADGKRVISLELGALVLSFIAASTDGDRPQVDRLIERYGSRWPGEWLRLRGLSDWAERFEQLTDEKEVAAYA